MDPEDLSKIDVFQHIKKTCYLYDNAFWEWLFERDSNKFQPEGRMLEFVIEIFP